MIGKTFGRWTVLETVDPCGNGYARVKCRCACGVIRAVFLSNLTRGLSSSCGCISVDRTTTHGKSKTVEYRAWQHMIERCENPHNQRYARYGARGIKVCDRWRKSFPDFLEDMGNRPSADHSIERIDNDGDYAPENCKWATEVEQGNNKSVNRLLLYLGKTQTITQWGRELCVNASTIRKRLSRGWNLERAMQKP